MVVMVVYMFFDLQLGKIIGHHFLKASVCSHVFIRILMWKSRLNFKELYGTFTTYGCVSIFYVLFFTGFVVDRF